jgi:hypothetical protein
MIMVIIDLSYVLIKKTLKFKIAGYYGYSHLQHSIRAVWANMPAVVTASASA